ncbi:MAG: glycosyltransferase [Candidatus Altiarchaeota archaeon]
MKILQITKYFYPHSGGIENNVLGISEGLVERKHKVIVLSSNFPKSAKYEIYHGVEIHRSRILFTVFRDPFALGMLINLLKKDYDLIHLHLPDPFSSFFAFFASIIRKKPLIVTYHADIIKEGLHYKILKFFYGFFQEVLLKHSKVIIATSPNYVNESEILRKFINKIEIIPNFVDEKKFSPEINLEKLRKVKEKYSLTNKKVILFVGRLVPYKGISYLIEAFKEVKKKIKNAKLVISGSGPLEKKLKEKSRGVDDITFINANADELPLIFRSADVFVLPSITRQEAFGIALLEAMSSGVACISTKISGMPFVLGDAGILVEPKNSKQLSEAIISILSNKTFANELGKKARIRVEENFTKDKVVGKLINLYERVLIEDKSET